MAEKRLTDQTTIDLCEAMGTELERQHENTGIHGLVMRRTEEAGTVILDGPVDLHALATAAARAHLGSLYKELVGYDPFEDDPTQTVADVRDLLLGVAREHRAAKADNLQDGGPMHARFLGGSR